VVSTAHGDLHRARRRLENAQFRAAILKPYERGQAASIIGDIVDMLADRPPVDLFGMGLRLSLVLAADRLGIDIDRTSFAQLDLFDREADGLAQMSEILDSKDPELTREIARESLAAWGADFAGPSIERRARLIEQHGPDSEQLPNDLVTALLVHRGDPRLGIVDDATIIRELATYLVGALHTNAMTLVNAVDLLLPIAGRDSSAPRRITRDRTHAQLWIHETLRLRPNTPRPKRYAEVDTTVAGRQIGQGSVVILNIAKANRDQTVFGTTADTFDAARRVPDGVARWGLSFGAGAHQCPGRSYAGGFPVPDDFAIDEEHLHGVVPMMLQEVVRRGVRGDPTREAVPDTRSERFTWWQSYPVALDTVAPSVTTASSTVPRSHPGSPAPPARPER
jgi:cytochrome P450